MKIPEPENGISSLVDRCHEDKAEPPRPHLGCSMLGHPCDRWLWLSFRWAVTEKFSGRMLRLFRRGQNEEATVVADLRAIGVDVRDVTGNQSRVNFGCHVSGSLDGIIHSGVPEAPLKKHVLEIKTHSKKMFDELEKNGVQESKPMHFVQMQVYMEGTGIDRALYVAVCKDDDRIYTERVKLDPVVAKKAIDRGKRIALSDRIPEPLSVDPSWYQCKFCAANAFCFDDEATKHVNCRTCAHATAKDDGTWRCERHDADGIPVDYQRTGCDSHSLHPDMVPWPQEDGLDEWTAVYVIDGKKVANGEPREGVFSSAEIVANASLCAGPDEVVNSLRASFGARIVG